jgi:hypothetical protein
MIGVFPNNCENCSTPLGSIRGEAQLNSERPNLHCPLCGLKFGPYLPQSSADDSARVFFDEYTQQYRVWVAEPSPEEVEEKVAIGNFCIRIRCRTLRIDDCLFERLFVFRPEADSWARRDPAQFSPIRPDHEYLIARWSFKAGSSSHREYKVTTNTGWTCHVFKPCAEVTELPKQPSAALFVWPNFVAKDWKRYYVSFYPPSIPTLLGSGRVEQIWTCKGEGRDSSFEEVSKQPWQGGELLSRPDRIVLSWTADGVKHFGSWRSDLNEPGVPHFEKIEFVRAENINIGFDFGTTNTAAAVHYQLPDEKKEPIESLKIRDRTLRLLGSNVSADLPWLPQPENGSKPLMSLPTQLMFESSQLLQSATANLIAPLQFTIPYYQSESIASETRSVGQFKWAKALGDLRKNAANYRALYLRLSLEMFLAEIVGACGIPPGPASLVATYPLAFSPEDMQLHRDSFEQAREAVESSTGFTISLGPSLDESHAGQSCDIPHRPGKYSLFIDVGGGTTDVCLSDPDNIAVLVVDSAEYGGEDLNERIFADGLTDRSPQQFRREIRTMGGAAFRSSELFARNNEKWQRSNKVRWHLQRGLVECAARYAAAETVNAPKAELLFEVYMLGLGWMTIFAEIETADAIAAEFAKKVNARLQQMKTAGIAKDVPTVSCEYPANPKSVVARGAARCLDVQRQAVDNSSRSFLLQDVRMVTVAAENVYAWSTRIPLTSNVQILRLEAIDLAKFAFETTTALPHGSNWAKDSLREQCVYQNVVVHSPFRLFLADYKRGG